MSNCLLYIVSRDRAKRWFHFYFFIFNYFAISKAGMPLGRRWVTQRESDRKDGLQEGLRKGQMRNGIQGDRNCLLTLHLNLWSLHLSLKQVNKNDFRRREARDKKLLHQNWQLHLLNNNFVDIIFTGNICQLCLLEGDGQGQTSALIGKSILFTWISGGNRLENIFSELILNRQPMQTCYLSRLKRLHSLAGDTHWIIRYCI